MYNSAENKFWSMVKLTSVQSFRQFIQFHANKLILLNIQSLSSSFGFRYKTQPHFLYHVNPPPPPTNSNCAQQAYKTYSPQIWHVEDTIQLHRNTISRPFPLPASTPLLTRIASANRTQPTTWSGQSNVNAVVVMYRPSLLRLSKKPNHYSIADVCGIKLHRHSCVMSVVRHPAYLV